jgi:hypothetical protein
MASSAVASSDLAAAIETSILAVDPNLHRTRVLNRLTNGARRLALTDG